MNRFAQDSANCRRLAGYAWIAVFVAYLGVLYMSLGWVGPYMAFMVWSAAAIPLFLLTSFWLYRARTRVRFRPFILLLLAWAALLLMMWVGDIADAPSVGFWLAFLLAGAFPLLVTWVALEEIERGDAAA